MAEQVSQEAADTETPTSEVSRAALGSAGRVSEAVDAETPTSGVGRAALGSAGRVSEAEDAATSTPAPARPRGRQVGLDMVRSMGLVAVVLIGWLLLSHPRTPDAVREVAWQPVPQSAAETAQYEVLAPPASWSWRATSARIEPQPDGTIGWRVGFYTPADDYAAVLQRGVFPAQATGSVQEWLGTETRQGDAVGTVELNGRQWTRMEGNPHPDDRRSLVYTEGGTLTVVTGSAEWSELEALARSLRPGTQE